MDFTRTSRRRVLPQNSEIVVSDRVMRQLKELAYAEEEHPAELLVFQNFDLMERGQLAAKDLSHFEKKAARGRMVFPYL